MPTLETEMSNEMTRFPPEIRKRLENEKKHHKRKEMWALEDDDSYSGDDSVQDRSYQQGKYSVFLHCFNQYFAIVLTTI